MAHITVTLETGVEVSISTTEKDQASGLPEQLDAETITLGDYFALESRVKTALGVLRERARKNSTMTPIYNLQANNTGNSDVKANKSERSEDKEESEPEKS